MMQPYKSLPIALSLALAVSCVGTTPTSDVPPPDLSLITVFYPMELNVHARGSANAIPLGPDGARPNCLYVAAHPSNRSGSNVNINSDGSFAFSVPASSADVLELAAFFVDRGESCEDSPNRFDRGTPVYLEVPTPPSRLYSPEFTCCYASAGDPRGGICVRPQTDEGSVCEETAGKCFSPGGGQACGPPDAALFMLPDYICQTRADCAHFAFQTIDLSDSLFSLSRPRADGLIKVIGFGPGEISVPAGGPTGLPPKTLVRVENRTQPSINRPAFPVRRFIVTDDSGHFELEIPGRGDDEFVIRVFGLDGSRSPEQAVYVPDAEFEHGEITGIYPYRTLYPGAPPAGAEAGKVAIRIALFGSDGRGLCPDSETSDSEPGPSLCFSANTPKDGFKGGLDFKAITELSTTIGNVADETRVLIPSTPSLPDLPYVKFVDGDISAPAQTVVLIVDNSSEAIEKDPGAFRFRAAETLINSLRSRDRMSIWVVEKEDGSDACGIRGGQRVVPKGMRCLIPPTGSKLELNTALNSAEFPPGGSELPGGAPKPLEAVYEAVLDLNARNITNGKVFLISLENQPGTESEIISTFEKILTIAEPDPELNRVGYPVIVLTNGERDPNNEGWRYMQDTAAFTFGEIQHVREARTMLEVAGRMIGSIAGAFVLLYDLELPIEIAADEGKIADLTVRGSILIDGISKPLAPFDAQLPFGDRPN